MERFGPELTGSIWKELPVTINASQSESLTTERCKQRTCEEHLGDVLRKRGPKTLRIGMKLTTSDAEDRIKEPRSSKKPLTG